MATPKKTAVKVTSEKKVPVKKSVFKTPDMPKLLDIFHRLKTLMKAYEPPFNARIDIEGKYDLWSEKEVNAFGRTYDSMYFVGITLKSGYVGFYYMPIYAEPEMFKALFKPELLKLLKGKSCFHVKELTPELEKQIEFALKAGQKSYKQKGWI